MKERKPIRKTAIPRALSAIECARRTGLTIRTLRVYEHAELITPRRGANGYRQYGEPEIRRLNAIMVLKTFGLTLREIRAALSSAAPSLAEILQLQLKTCLARQAAAEQSLKLVRAALARLTANETLSIDELCELARSTEMSKSPLFDPSAWREVVNEMLKPEEEREYLTWWAKRPPDAASSMREFALAQQPLFDQLEALRAKGADPASPKVQALIDRHRELMTKHRVREQTVAMMEWNPELTRKYMAAGERFRNRSPSLLGFFIAASRASKPGEVVKRITEETELLIKRKLAPTSAEAQQLARRLVSLCKRFKLGDAVVFALSTAFIAKSEHDGEWLALDTCEQAPYRFLAEAVRASAESHTR